MASPDRWPRLTLAACPLLSREGGGDGLAKTPKPRGLRPLRIGDQQGPVVLRALRERRVERELDELLDASRPDRARVPYGRKDLDVLVTVGAAQRAHVLDSSEHGHVRFAEHRDD